MDSSKKKMKKSVFYQRIIEKTMKELYDAMDCLIKKSREKSLMLTKLDEARFWAKDAVVKNIDDYEEPQEAAQG